MNPSLKNSGPALAFGTGGIRGVMGEGPGRFNGQLVARATAGLAAWLKARDPVRGREKGAAIAYDTRHNSRQFAALAAAVLEAAGIPVRLFPGPAPTPALSFAVRHLGCAAGVVITASHNPKAYNGYKVYNAQGGQLVPKEAGALAGCIPEAPPALPAPPRAPSPLGEDVAEAFLAAVARQSLLDAPKAKADLGVVYTPLHGSGGPYVGRALERAGFTALWPVAAQFAPDGDFPTIPTPNPEDPAALAMAVAQAGRQGADIAIATDPDCDRVAAAVRRKGGWRYLSGNEAGALLLDFLITLGQPPPGGALIKTIVTGDLGAAVARAAGLAVYETLTGFKYIGEMIGAFERGGGPPFVFGYEESCGFLVGGHCRDKDAVTASLLLCEAAAWHKAQGRTLADALWALEAKHGVFLDALDSVAVESADAFAGHAARLRGLGGAAFSPAAQMTDYAVGVGGLPRDDTLTFRWPDGTWLALRPSGTEPKVKLYYCVRGGTRAQAGRRLAALRRQARALLAGAERR